jgi:hypothetical protein
MTGGFLEAQLPSLLRWEAVKKSGGNWHSLSQCAFFYLLVEST